MRLKTLGVVLITVLAIFTIVYWVTDDSRRDVRAEAQDQTLMEYGEELFGPINAEEGIAFSANCARCHGPEGMGGQVGDTGVTAPNLHSSRIYDKLQKNGDYVELVIRNGGIVVSGNVDSPMPAWKETLNRQQIEALEALVTEWATEAAKTEPEGTPVPDTAEAGRDIFLGGTSPACASCHGQDLEGGAGPSLQTIGSEPVTDLPTPISGLARLQDDYAADKRAFLELWIRDSGGNYNDGEGTGMPAYTPEMLPDDAIQALITYLLEQQ